MESYRQQPPQCLHLREHTVETTHGNNAKHIYTLFHHRDGSKKNKKNTHTQLHRLKEKFKTYSTHIVTQITKKEAKICNAK